MRRKRYLNLNARRGKTWSRTLAVKAEWRNEIEEHWNDSAREIRSSSREADGGL